MSSVDILNAFELQAQGLTRITVCCVTVLIAFTSALRLIFFEVF